MSSYIPSGKPDLTPRRHHGYAVILFIMGTLFPPLAVAARFGIGKDFWLNIVLTICGYIPGAYQSSFIANVPANVVCQGHCHNFYIQNIRNNKNHARTPKWIQRYGLVDTSEIKRKERKSQWANRYNDRLPSSALEGQPYEEGQEASSSVDLSTDAANGKPRKQPDGDLWRPEDESYYNPHKSPATSSSGRWHYPANFDDVEPISNGKKSKKKKEKKDRWERTQDAYSMSAEDESQKKKKKKKRKSSETASIVSTRDSNEFPEDPEGGLYGGPPDPPSESSKKDKTTTEEVFAHQF